MKNKDLKKDVVGKGVANGNTEEESGANIEDEGTRMGRDDKRNGTFGCHFQGNCKLNLRVFQRQLLAKSGARKRVCFFN